MGVHNSSALQAALASLALDEAGQAMGVSRVGLYLDLEKFYDNISLARLMRAADQLGYPRTELILITQVYLAPRVVRVREAYAATGEGGRAQGVSQGVARPT